MQAIIQIIIWASIITVLVSKANTRKIGGLEVGDTLTLFNRIIVAGGEQNFKEKSSVELLEIPTSDEFGTFDQGDETYATQLTDFPVTISGGVAAGFPYAKGKMVMICGGEQNGSISADCWIKEEGIDGWKMGTPMPEPRKNAAYVMVEANTKLIVMGGATIDGTLLNSTIVFWPDNRTWTAEPKLTLPFPNQRFSIAWRFRDFAVTGGSDGYLGRTDAMIFNPISKKDEDLIEVLPNMTDQRQGHASFVERVEGLTDMSIIVAGGKSRFTPIRRTEVFDNINENAWISGPALPRDFVNGCVITDLAYSVAYLIGGHPTDGRVILFAETKFHLTNIRLRTPRQNCVCAMVPDHVDLGDLKEEVSTEKITPGNMSGGGNKITVGNMKGGKNINGSTNKGGAYVVALVLVPLIMK